jgi:hypothetical protein
LFSSEIFCTVPKIKKNCKKGQKFAKSGHPVRLKEEGFFAFVFEGNSHFSRKKNFTEQKKCGDVGVFLFTIVADT